jgi:DNA-binding transcriptional LysR family regulator
MSKENQWKIMKKNHLTERFHTVRGFDLNLLTMFEAVFIHGSVTKAADILGITPSAVSQALGRLRDHFYDPLFVRQGKILIPTTTAISIHDKMAAPYDNLLSHFQEIEKPLANRNLVINSPQYISISILPVLIKITEAMSPGCKLTQTIGENSHEMIEELLTYRKADIVFDFSPHHHISRNSQLLYEEDLVLICAKTHPRINEQVAGGTVSIDAISNEHFTLASNETQERIIITEKIEKILGITRKIRYVVGSVTAVFPVVEASETLAVIPRAAYEQYKNTYNVRIINTDMVLPKASFYMIYNKSSLINKFFASLISNIENIYPKA